MPRAAAVDPDSSIPVRVRWPDVPPPGPPPELAQGFILTFAGAALLGALLLAAQPDTRRVMPVALGYLLLAVAAALSWRARPSWHLRLMSGLFLGGVLVVGLGAFSLRWGLSAPALPLLPLLVCALTAAGGLRLGAALAAVSALLVLGVSLHAGALPPPGAGPDALLLVGTHLLGIALALAAGVILGRGVIRSRQAAHQREQRFRRLLSLATDAYWEIDSDYKLVAAGQHDLEMRSLQAHTGLGRVPWDLPRFECDPATLDLLMADLETRSPFRDRPFSWRDRHGGWRSYLASGEPRLDARGVFRGYWGVARDVTAVMSARAALLATETRYQDLFACIPTPLVLQRHGRVIDANPAALHLLGLDSPAELLGADLLDYYEPGDSRERERSRTEQLHTLPDGAALPVSHFQLQVKGRVLHVQAAGVRVQAPGGTALLSIYVDMTERRATEEAVRRSEAMLAHLVATSPDLITLTDLGTGRYAMVNQAFERVTGWRADEVVGRTSLDLGVWGQARSRDSFLQTLRDKGSVSDVPVDFVSKRGDAISLLVSAARFVMDRHDYLVINARDVTEGERARMEREAILENASVGIAVTRHRRFVLANPHFEQMFGWSAGELAGQPGQVVWPTEADYLEVGRTMGPALARGEAVSVERATRRKDGSHFLARTHGRAIDPAHPVDGGTVWIVEDVTERREFERALARARDDAEAANRAKSAFLANTSHELRTPLNGMIGLARMARDPGIGEALRSQYLDQITDSAQALAAIISDILDLSKIEAGKLQIEATAFDLTELLQVLEHTYRTLAAMHGLALQVEVDAGLRGLVSGDALRVRQIVTNFLANAIKFTARGEVRLRAHRLDERRVRFEVVDTGPGIPPEALDRIFMPFTQADQSTTRRFGGTGLGLSICRELATLMGGRVGVDSQPDQGSCFWAELPLPVGESVVPPTLPGPAPDCVANALAGLRVLMVEDNTVNMLIAVAMLEQWGVAVTQAHDGREAVAAVQLSAAEGRPFDAVLMDVQMPVMSGYEATRALRLTEAGRHLPIVAITAAALVTERDEAMSAGMSDFLTKPIDAAKLHAVLLRCRRPTLA